MFEHRKIKNTINLDLIDKKINEKASIILNEKCFKFINDEIEEIKEGIDYDTRTIESYLKQVGDDISSYIPLSGDIATKNMGMCMGVYVSIIAKRMTLASLENISREMKRKIEEGK